MVNRIANLSKTNSFFLFGNRGVGKSTLLEGLFHKQNHPWFDLLDPALEKKLSLNPSLLEQILQEEKRKYPKGTFVIIDEVQKIPQLLNIVHSQIEQKYFHFVLTGSSARKLKKHGTNLLGGRAFVYFLFPFTHLEIGQNFDLLSTLQWGSLPKVFEYEKLDKVEYLNAYTNTYLREEIIAEQLVRQITPFRQFLEVAAQSNCKILNYSKIAEAVGVDTTTVQNYFQILEDTFTGVLLQPYDQSLRKRQRKNPKFYFFDTGITRSLQNRLTMDVVESTYEYGDLFEQFIILEFLRLNEYFRKSWKFSYLQTKDNVEVDLIIEQPGHYPNNKVIFIEIKSTKDTESLDSSNLNGFINLVKSHPQAEALVISQDPIHKNKNGVRYLHWKAAFQELFGLSSS
jgi:predicted AAA+ superfamily ATPase